MRSSRSLAGHLFLSLALSAVVSILASTTALAQIPLRQYDPTLRQMFDAIRTKSYDRFVAEGDELFKANFTPKMFDGLARQLGPKLQQHYSMSFLTTLNQQEFTVYVWKLSFDGVRDDYLVTLFIKEGRVSGFVVR